MKKIILFTFIITCHFLTNAQTDPAIDALFRNSYTVFELQRLPNGMYRDSKLLSGADYHPISIANTGMGLVALCIADAMGWIDNAEQLALETLKTATGNAPGFTPDRTTNGFYRHFMDINTGAQEWNSEYSTIDTDILVCGALFSAKYFQSSSITQYAMELWNSINFNAAIANTATGQIFLTMNADGSGDGSSLTSPYNEYMIVAWLAKNSSDDPNSLGNTLWNNYYNTTNSLPKNTYDGYSVLSDNGASFLSSFTHQFNYFLCHYFTTSNEYLTFFENSQKADESWWANSGSDAYEWGLGAGSAISDSYHADAINNNIDAIVSPHIVAGYLPIHPDGKNDLIAMWNNNRGKLELPNGNNDPMLCRYSKSQPTWAPKEITGVDHASMLFGLATLPEYLGNNYFSTNNDFFSNPILNLEEVSAPISINAYPNPATDALTIQLDKKYQQVSLQITDSKGQAVYFNEVNELDKINVPLSMSRGLYFVTVGHHAGSKTFKIIKQ